MTRRDPIEGAEPHVPAAPGVLRTAPAALLARPVHLVLAVLVAGLLLGPGAARIAILLAGALLAVVAAAGRPRLGVALCVACVLGAGWADHRVARQDASAAAPGRAVTAQATLLGASRPTASGGWRATAQVPAADVGSAAADAVRVVLRAPPPVAAKAVPVQPGEVVAIAGRTEPPGPAGRHDRSRGVAGWVVLRSVEPTGRRRGGIAGAVDAVRRRAERGVSAGLQPAQAALARGMVLGQDEALDPAVREAFQVSGLAHLLAASGQNVALLALLATALLGLAGAPLRTRLLVALALVALYVPLAGAGPSIQRAGVMGAATLVAGLAGRPSSRAHAVLLAAAVTLVAQPLAREDVGWQLSFAAVLAIALLAPRVRRALVRRRVPRPVAEAVAVTAAATAGTAPLLALSFGEVSLVSLPANVAAAVAVAPVVWLGTVAGALGQAGGLGLVLASGVQSLAAAPLGFVGWVADLAARTPGAQLEVRLGVLAATAAWAALACVALSRGARRALAGAAIGAVAVVAAGAGAPGHRSAPPAEIAFLAVGQGDATLVRAGREAVLVDTGPPGGPLLSELRRLGVERLALLVLTHASADHEGGAPRLLRELDVAAVLDGARGAHPPQLEAALRAEGARVIEPIAGQRLDVAGVRLDVLWPRPGARSAADPNDRAVVLHAAVGGMTALLPADAEGDVLASLPLRGVDVLKVSHHGSADPALPATLARARPAIAAIPVGPNPYGHPAPSTVHALAGAVPRVLRTDRDGTISITPGAAGGLAVRTDRQAT